LLLRVKQVSSLVQQCYELVEFTESFGNTFGESLAVDLEVHGRRHSGADLRSEIINLVEDCDQVDWAPRTDQALHIREFVQEATSQDLSSGFQVLYLPRVGAEVGGPIFKLCQPIPHFQYEQARPCDETQDLAVITPDRLSSFSLERVPAIFSSAGSFYLLNSVRPLRFSSLS
jgi:hypothetical protein